MSEPLAPNCAHGARDPLSPSSMFEGSPLSVVVPEKSLLSDFQVLSYRGQFYCSTETDSRARFDRSPALRMHARNRSYRSCNQDSLLDTTISPPRISWITQMFSMHLMFHGANIAEEARALASSHRLLCHASWKAAASSPHVGQGSCANDLHNRAGY